MNLKPKQTRFSTDEEAIRRHLEQMAAEAGVSPKDFMRAVNDTLIGRADPRRALNNLQRFLSTGFSTTAIRDFLLHPVLRETALELFSQSQLLADILVREPELLHWLTATNELGMTKTREHLTGLAMDSIAPFMRGERKLDALKRMARREVLRCGARDVLREADVPELTRELAHLADAVVETVLSICLAQAAGDYKYVPEPTLAVIGLGKFGGEELNFSSDIDFMFVYDEGEDAIALDGRAIPQREYYSRIAEAVVRALTEKSNEGHLYRVDLRLRPDGKAGALVMSRQAYFTYYETRGELWERQMLSKARVVAGNRSVGESFLRSLDPFVFPRSLEQSPLAEIAEIKRRIEAKTSEANVKLGSGGIRDIEFIVQALALINAGARPALKERNTLLLLERLLECGLVKKGEAQLLREAYIFFRRVEHRLQLLEGRQTHSLPESAGEMETLARRLGYKSGKQFQSELDGYRKQVKRHFDALFNPAKGSAKRNKPDSGATALDRIGVNERVEAEKLFARLRARIPVLADPAGAERFLRCAAPLHTGDAVLRGMVKLAENDSLRRTLQAAFEREQLLSLLLTLSARAGRLVDLLAADPLLFETLIGNAGDMLEPGRWWEYLAEHDRLKYRQYNQFKIVLRLCMGASDIETAAAEFSDLAEEMLLREFRRALADAGRDPDVFPGLLVALGKLGGREISFGSDLDVVYVFRKGAGSTAVVHEKILRKFLERMEERGNALYEVDFRLRPEGRNAPLAVEFGYYKEYLAKRASLWERQALVRSRILSGEKNLVAAYEAERLACVFEHPLPAGWVGTTMAMRKRIDRERAQSTARAIDLKCGIGGLLDLEYAVQMLQLQRGGIHAQVRSANTFEALHGLRTVPGISKADVQLMLAGLTYLRRLDLLIRTNSETANMIPTANKELARVLASGMGFAKPEEFIADLKERMAAHRALLLRTAASIESAIA